MSTGDGGLGVVALVGGVALLVACTQFDLSEIIFRQKAYASAPRAKHRSEGI